MKNILIIICTLLLTASSIITYIYMHKKNTTSIICIKSDYYLVNKADSELVISLYTDNDECAFTKDSYIEYSHISTLEASYNLILKYIYKKHSERFENRVYTRYDYHFTMSILDGNTKLNNAILSITLENGQRMNITIGNLTLIEDIYEELTTIVSLRGSKDPLSLETRIRNVELELSEPIEELSGVKLGSKPLLYQITGNKVLVTIPYEEMALTSFPLLIQTSANTYLIPVFTYLTDYEELNNNIQMVNHGHITESR